jgi:hypothetical protein
MPIVYDREKYSPRCPRTGEAGYPTPWEGELRPYYFHPESTVTSIAGYNASALFVDDHSGLKWLYGLKSKDAARDAAQRWMEISELQEKYPLLVVMRDNAGENKLKEISDYFTGM